MKKISDKDIPITIAHNEVPRKALIKVGECQSKLQTINDAYLEAGKSFLPHIHDTCEEVYYFLEGVGELTIDGNMTRVSAGDCILIEQGESHGLKNTGNQKLRFISVRVSL